MARKKGGPSRMDLRRQAEALEARENPEAEVVVDEEEEEEEEDEDAEGEVDAEADAEADAESDEDEDGVPKKKKAKVKAKAKPKAKKPAAPKKARTPKEVRMKAVWVVFDNGGKRVETFPFPQKAEAEAALAKRQEDKKTFYLLLVKDKYDE